MRYDSKKREMEMLRELIKTDRLKLRLFSLKDVEDVLLYASDPEWARFLPVPQPYTRADAEKFVAGQLLRDRKSRLCWAIEHAGSVIGGINIGFDFDNRVGEMGYSIARRFWGKGLTTEAAGAVIDESFSVYPDLNRIRAAADERNVGSLRVMEKLGMVREGILRQDIYLRGEFKNMVWCGLLRCEWEARKNR